MLYALVNGFPNIDDHVPLAPGPGIADDDSGIFSAEIAIFEAVSERVHGRTFAHSCSTAYMAWLEATRTPWTPHFMEAAVPSVSCDQPGTTNAVGRSHV